MTTTTPPALETRRVSQLLPSFSALSAFCIGVGGVGRPLAELLALSGIGVLHLCDPDTVEPHNLPSQGWSMEHLGMPKVEALDACLLDSRPNLHLESHHCKFENILDEDLPLNGGPDAEDDEEFRELGVNAVFVAVDSMEARKTIASRLQELDYSGPIFDARVGVQSSVIRILSFTGKANCQAWRATLIDDKDAVNENDCTRQFTLFAGSIAASFLVLQWSHLLRGKAPIEDMTFNLLDPLAPALLTGAPGLA